MGMLFFRHAIESLQKNFFGTCLSTGLFTVVDKFIGANYKKMQVCEKLCTIFAQVFNNGVGIFQQK
ncbi:hypothetical protein HMPREF1147_1173 [Selenomonas sp. FOBRC9]|nr:hypothetical protein HMPREF1147_1173 [Selenomonas sp. FOBRC9]